MPVEKSGQNEFDFEYGDDFGAHIEKFDPDFSKVLVRYNPDDDAEMNERQLARLKRLADWLHDQRPQVPVRAAGAGHRRAARVGRRRHRPLRRRAAPGADAPRDRGHPELRASRSTSGRSRASTSGRRADARRAGPLGEGREGVTCVLLGRGASTEKVEEWLAGLRRSRASSASRSAARSGGTRSRASSTTTSSARRRRADRRQLPALRQRLRAPAGRADPAAQS